MYSLNDVDLVRMFMLIENLCMLLRNSYLDFFVYRQINFVFYSSGA